MMAVRTVLPLVVVLLLTAMASRAQLLRVLEEGGVSGYVLAPDGSPVMGGSVVLMNSPASRVTVGIDRTGRFRIVPDQPGPQRLFVAVPGYAPYRVNVVVPPSRTLQLPIVRLLPATYFRARFVTTEGEAIGAPALRRRSVEAGGASIPDPFDRVADQVDGDGTITIGPLPLGRTLVAFDRPAFAQTRLPDLQVTGTDTLVDGGTIAIRPGAALHVDIVDAAGAPVGRHDVWLEDAAQPSPLFFPPARTNEQGRATFDRLGAGRYRVWTRTVDRCRNQPLTVSRLVSAGGNGFVRTRLVAGGRATFRFTSRLGPVSGRSVSASPESPSPAPWQPRFIGLGPLMRRTPEPRAAEPTCVGLTDGDGRVTFATFPPGPASVDLRLFNSTIVRRVTVPEDGREVAIEIPDGLAPVRVTNSINNQPVAGARITWTGGGGRVEAMASPNGDALLESVGTAGGTLTISARQYETLEGSFPEAPATLQEVALTPVPSSRLQARVVANSGEAVPNAVVELASASPIDASDVAVADAAGVVTFIDAPAGMLRLTASAAGFVPATLRVTDDNRTAIVVTLARGHRVSAAVELTEAGGPYLVRVVNDAGVSADALLDLASDRIVDAPGRLSVGPLPPGAYVIELHRAGQRREERIQIADRDLTVVIR